MPTSQLDQILQRQYSALLQEWLRSQLSSVGRQLNPGDERTLAANSGEFLTLFSGSVNSGELRDIYTPSWEKTRDFLASLSVHPLRPILVLLVRVLLTAPEEQMSA